MNQRTLTALIVLNLVLLLGILISVLAPAPALAQARAGSDYIMLSGEVLGRPTESMVYIVDPSTQRVAGLLINAATKEITVIDHRSISADLENLSPIR